ncbi:MAG: hypothetical protein JNK72_22285 [Myxococcales bacterium]|nr:hypothetical protein [Myxococcales bacterium]
MTRAALLAMALAATGCIESLDSKELVTGPRILDMVADRPEVNPGQSVSLSVFLAGLSENAAPTYRWQWCVANTISRGATNVSDFGTNSSESGCFGTDGGAAANLGTGPTATLPVPANLLEALEEAARRAAMGGQNLPVSPEVIAALARDIGLVLGFAVTVEVDGRVLRGYKRVVVSANRENANTNPPAPRFRFDGRWVGREAGSDRRCVAEDGRPLTAPRNASVALAPDGDETAWQQRYTILNATGTLATREERGFYAWYASSGDLARQSTRSPTRDNAWRTGAAAGPQTLWVFLRDGHGGTSACETPVTVE